MVQNEQTNLKVIIKTKKNKQALLNLIRISAHSVSSYSILGRKQCDLPLASQKSSFPSWSDMLWPIMILAIPHLDLWQYVLSFIFWWTPKHSTSSVALLLLNRGAEPLCCGCWLHINAWLAFVTANPHWICHSIWVQGLSWKLSSSQPILMHLTTPALTQDFTFLFTETHKASSLRPSLQIPPNGNCWSAYINQLGI